MNGRDLTDFLDRLWSKVPQRQRDWHDQRRCYDPPRCQGGCGRLVRWSVKNRDYSRFCGPKCAHQDPSVRQKTQDTCMIRYGAKTNLQTEDTKQQIRETCQARYGVDNYSKSEGFKNKFKEVCLQRYGVDNPSKLSWVRDKIDQSHFDRYGRKRSSQVHIDPATIDLKNDAGEMKKWFFDLKMPVTAIAEILGVNHSQLCVHFKKNLGIDVSRHVISYPEQQLQAFIRALEPQMIANDRQLIGPKELDIVIPEKKIAIEYHGLAWHSELRGRKSRTYHLEKLQQCQRLGFRLIQIFSNEWLTQRELVTARLTAILGQGTRSSARNCELREIDHGQANLFFKHNHLQGSCVSSVNLGLFDHDQLVMAASFGRPRFNRNFQWELLRMASLRACTVRGGADRLFKRFIKLYDPQSVISYCDRRWNTGEVYAKIGFRFEKNLGPNYWYTRDYLTIENRMTYQKARLIKSLEDFDPNETEWQNMARHGFDRVWDCGNSLWRWDR